MASEAAELSRRVWDDFENRLANNNRFSYLYDSYLSGKEISNETLEELRKHSIKELIASLKSVTGELPSSIDEEFAGEFLRPILEQDYKFHSEIARDVQEQRNRKAGLGLKAVPPDVPNDRIDGLVKKFASYETTKEAEWLLNAPINTFTRSVYDDTVRKNAEFQSKAGLRPRIIRKAVGKCCEWCQALAGKYDYPDNVPRDVYRRHANCNCTVEYDPGVGKRVQDVWSKRWTRAEESGKIERRKELEKNAELKESIRRALRLPNAKHIDVPAKKIDVDALGFDEEHFSKAGRGISREQAKQWIMDAVFSVDVWNGQYTRFISNSGATYVDNFGGFIRTAFSEADFTENYRKALEMIHNAEL